MLCEERGFFLEIADLIRGLGLTILKGVMETKNDKIWACFAVEVILQKGTCFFSYAQNILHASALLKYVVYQEAFSMLVFSLCMLDILHAYA